MHEAKRGVTCQRMQTHQQGGADKGMITRTINGLRGRIRNTIFTIERTHTRKIILASY